MLIVLLFLVFAHGRSDTPGSPLRSLDPLVIALHQGCLNRVPHESRHRDLHQAIVCGRELPDGPQWSLLRDSGLLHLTVVSGAHLLLLSQGLTVVERWGRGLRLLHWLVLGLYTLTTLASPPVMRAFLQIVLSRMSQRLELKWRTPMVTALSGVATLALDPALARSWSLLLSWTASLVTSPLFRPRGGSGAHHAALHYLLLLPVLGALGPYHPQTILFNWLLGPVLGLMLFPVTLIAFAAPPIFLILDPAWSLILATLEAFTLPLNPTGPMSTPPLLCWAYLMLLQSLAIRMRAQP